MSVQTTPQFTHPPAAAGKLSGVERRQQLLSMTQRCQFLSFPQKLATSLAWPTSPSDSRTVSSTRVPQNSSLQTSSSTHPSTSCLNCEAAARSQRPLLCCSYWTVTFSVFSPSIYFRCFVYSFPPPPPPPTWSPCGGTHRNSADTFQHFAESTADCNYSYQLSVYTVVYVSKWKDSCLQF